MQRLDDTFWKKVARREHDDCWEWSGKRSKKGYGLLSVGGRKGKTMRAHRVSWTISHGAIPDGLCVLHRCDNPPCVNPSHLFLGTNADNTRDMMSKGRMSKPPRHIGDSHPRAKLTTDQMEAIKADREDALTLASRYGVSRKLIYCVRRGDARLP